MCFGGGSGGRGETKGKQRERRGGKNGKSKKKKKINEPWGRISKGEERDRRLCARGNPFFSSLSLFPGPFCSKKPPSIFSFLSDPAVTLSPKTDQRNPFHQKRKFGGGVFFQITRVITRTDVVEFKVDIISMTYIYTSPKLPGALAKKMEWGLFLDLSSPPPREERKGSGRGWCVTERDGTWKRGFIDPAPKLRPAPGSVPLRSAKPGRVSKGVG